MELAKKIYRLTHQLPQEEIYGMTSQIRRAAVSIPSNIAEGHERQYRKEFIQFLYHALGSLAELETQLLLSRDIYQAQLSPELIGQMKLLGRKLRKLIQALDRHPSVSSPPAPSL